MKKLLPLLAFTAAALLSPLGQANTFGFAGLSASDMTTYQGFNWSGGDGANSWVSGALGGPDAPLGAAWSNGGTNLSMKLDAPGTFTFDSISLFANASAWGGSPSAVTIEGWLAGKVIDTFTTPILDSLSRTAYTNFVLDWGNIDTVTFNESPNENIELTNVTINAVPEPASIALILAGLLGFCISRKRNNRV